MEFGSGTGIHGRLLAEKSYSVVGIEGSARMVSKAKLSPGFNISIGDVRSIHLQKTFDTVLALFHVINYMLTNEDVCAFFSSAAKHLSPGGLFIFDTWYSPAVLYELPSIKVKRIKNSEWDLLRISEPTVLENLNRVDIDYTIYAQELQTNRYHVVKERHSIRHFSQPELAFFASQAGLELISSKEMMTGSVPSKKTWSVCQIYRKS